MASRPIPVEHRSILVPLDGSALAETVLPLAAELASGAHADILLAKVHEPPAMAMANAFQWDREVEQRELDYLACVAGRVERQSGVCVRTKLLSGHAADAICHAARHHEQTLILMSSHGRTGFSRLWLGSVADAIVRESRAPVLIVRRDACAEGAATENVERVLVPLDGSATAEAILPHAMWLCRASNASLELMRVIPPDAIPRVEPTLQEDATQAALRAEEAKLREVAERLCALGAGAAIGVVVRVHDSAAAAISDYAAAEGISAIALTTRGSGLARLVGSVADKVIRTGPPIILLFRPPESGSPAFP